MKPRIMYIEEKSSSLNGPARIGWVSYNKTGRTASYAGRQFRKVRWGYKYNHVEVGTGVHYWISGCKKGGGDRLYVSNLPIEIDEDAREGYWSDIRNMPHFSKRATV